MRYRRDKSIRCRSPPQYRHKAHLIKDRWLDRYFNDIVFAQDGGINPNSIIALNGKTFAEEYGISFSKVPEFANFDKNNTIQKAIAFSKSTRNETKGITVLDFDDTLATTRSLVRYTGPNGETGTLNAEQFASTYQDLLEQGYTFDFSEFKNCWFGTTMDGTEKTKVNIYILSNAFDHYDSNKIKKFIVMLGTQPQ